MSEMDTKTVADHFFVIGFASSAGGLNALSIILSALPLDFAAAIIVVQHVSPDHKSYLVDILKRRTPLPVMVAQDNERLKPGSIYVAPPDWHLIIKPGGILKLNQEDRLHFLRPSADLMFKSLADSFTNHAIAVVLTGTGIDGVNGIRAIKAKGGTVIAQDEATSEFFGMPGKAIETGHVDFILPLDKIASFLESFISR